VNPFRFGVQSYSADSKAEWCDRARQAEDLGYSCLSVADHYLGPGDVVTATRHPVQSLAAIPAMTMAAAVTSSIAIGARVMCIDYRNPVVLAKELATIELFSEGRLEMGLGAGWLHGEYDAMGVKWDGAGDRIARLADVITMIKAFMGGENLDLVFPSGVVAQGFAGVPASARRPHPPVMIGGGRRKVLELAGREADIVSINFDNSSGKIGPGVPTSTAAATDEKIGWIRAGALGRATLPELEIGAYFTVVTDDAPKVAEQFGAMFGLPTDEMLHHPHALIGTVDSICDELQARRERYGISYVTVGGSVMEAFAPVVARLSGT
jgi:probable F420-dependent oxidoreductase